MEKGSTLKALLCHPGVCPTALVPTLLANTDIPASSLQDMVNAGHAVKDGALPLLSCICNPDANSEDFYGPWTDDESALKFDGECMTGAPKRLDSEEPLSKDKERQLMMWEASEKAIGQPFFA